MYDILLQALRLTSIPVSEGAWDRAPQSGPYIVVAMDSEASAVWADGRQQEQALEGAVHLFARDNGKGNMMLVQHILDTYEISYRLNSVQHETRAGIVHYEWIIQLEAL